MSRTVESIRFEIRKAVDRLFIEPECSRSTLTRLTELHEELIVAEGRG